MPLFINSSSTKYDLDVDTAISRSTPTHTRAREDCQLIKCSNIDRAASEATTDCKLISVSPEKGRCGYL